jgi:hypothetical protein
VVLINATAARLLISHAEPGFDKSQKQMAALM